MSDSEKEEKAAKVDEGVQIRDLNLKVHRGEFICIIGGVGSGKSSLLSALLGDMIYISDETIQEFQGKLFNDVRHDIIERTMNERGIVKLGGTVSYVQQQPWIQNKTIRDNILFGLPMDERKYNQTIELCELANDLEILPGGDLTEIGEKGINLSGGQKARVSLARAVYADSDILLMDDPISALDSNVKKSIFKNLFCGELRGKTRVLVTHAVEFLEKVDRIIVMEKGKVKYNGTYEEIQHSDEIQHILKSLEKTARKESENEEDKEEDKDSEEEEDQEEKPDKDDLKKSHMSEKGTHITEDENEEKIVVGWNVYFSFFIKDYSWVFYVVFIIMSLTSAFATAQGGIYTGILIDPSSHEYTFWQLFFINLGLAVAASILTTIVMTGISLSTVRLTKNLHIKMLETTANAPVNLYFDKTPSGRILNRYSSDINKLDNGIDK